MTDYYIVNVYNDKEWRNVYQHEDFKKCKQAVIKNWIDEALRGDVTITHFVIEDISVCWEDYK